MYMSKKPTTPKGSSNRKTYFYAEKNQKKAENL